MQNIVLDTETSLVKIGLYAVHWCMAFAGISSHNGIRRQVLDRQSNFEEYVFLPHLHFPGYQTEVSLNFYHDQF